MHRYCAYRTGDARNNSDDLKNYPEIELKWSEPGIAFRVTFRKKNYTPEMAEIVGISPKGVEWQIAKLKKEDRIKRIGPDKGGYWEVIK